MPQLLNVVQELAIAANVPMPRVYLINDTAPNAFATGRDPQHASVAITIGLLQKLDREELQGVMAHELSHVRNFDIRFSLMVGVLVGLDRAARRLLPAVHVLGRRPAGAAGLRSDDAGGGFAMVMMVVAIVLAILAPIAARLVQMAVSRQREYLADASGVELTRNPYGLERALAKIALDTEPLEVANRATQHLYFENPVKAATGNEQVAVLDPPAGARPDQPAAAADEPAPGAGAPAVVLDPAAAERGAARTPGPPPVVGAGAVAARSGSVLFSGAPTGPRGDPGPGRDSSVGRARD